jgi:hypothetical protein
VALLRKKTTDSAKPITNVIHAMWLAVPAIPLRPDVPAMIAMIGKIGAHPSIELKKPIHGLFQQPARKSPRATHHCNEPPV